MRQSHLHNPPRYWAMGVAKGQRLAGEGEASPDCHTPINCGWPPGTLPLSLALSHSVLGSLGMLQRRGGRQTPNVPQATRTRPPQPLRHPPVASLAVCFACAWGERGREGAAESARWQWGWDCGTGSGSGHVALMSSRSCSRSPCLARPLLGREEGGGGCEGPLGGASSASSEQVHAEIMQLI